MEGGAQHGWGPARARSCEPGYDDRAEVDGGGLFTQGFADLAVVLAESSGRGEHRFQLLGLAFYDRFKFMVALQTVCGALGAQQLRVGIMKISGQVTSHAGRDHPRVAGQLQNLLQLRNVPLVWITLTALT